jgi:hypothetical protein
MRARACPNTIMVIMCVPAVVQPQAHVFARAYAGVPPGGIPGATPGESRGCPRAGGCSGSTIQQHRAPFSGWEACLCEVCWEASPHLTALGRQLQCLTGPKHNLAQVSYGLSPRLVAWRSCCQAKLTIPGCKVRRAPHSMPAPPRPKVVPLHSGRISAGIRKTGLYYYRNETSRRIGQLARPAAALQSSAPRRRQGCC